MRQKLVTALSTALSDQQGAMTKEEANYRPADNEQECCAHCSNFHGAQCDIVAGRIAPHYVSDHFEPADSTGDPSADTKTAPKASDMVAA